MINSPSAASPIVLSGSIAIDRIMRFEGRYRDLISVDNLGSLSIAPLLNQMEVSEGGVAANIAYTLALLGDKPLLLGSVGPDGAAYMERLAQQGVDITHVHRSEIPTGSFNVITDSDENQVGGFYPGAMSDSGNLSFEPWKATKAIVLVGPHDPAAMRRQVAEAAKWDLRLTYDPSQQVASLSPDELREGLETAEVLILNDYEMGIMSDKVGLSRAELRAKVPVMITTLGKDGSVIEGTQVPETLDIEVVKPERVADPTGAGDAFRAGLLHGLVRGWDLPVCGRLGAVCAAYAVEQHGTQSHTFTFDEVAARYEAAFGRALIKSEI